MKDRPGLKWLLFSTLVFCIALCTGCGLDKQFVTAVDTSWGIIGPEYVKHISDCSGLDEDSKKIALRHAQSLTDLIAEAKKEHE